MSYVRTKRCGLCGLRNQTTQVHYDSYPMHGDPARPVDIPVCSKCAEGWNGSGGSFTGGAFVATRMMNRLIKVTRRPWEWSLHLPVKSDGRFYMSQGTILPKKMMKSMLGTAR